MQLESIFPKWVWLVYLGFFVFSIPWYLPADIAMQLIGGLPAWLIFSILSVCLAAIFTSWVIRRFWKDED